MQLQNSYYYFTSALNSEQCQNIINLGLQKIQISKNKGVNTAAVTAGNTHKQANPKNYIGYDDVLRSIIYDYMNSKK